VVERRLAEARKTQALPRVEILNFATPGYKIVRNLAQLEHNALLFDPDWVIVAAENHVWRAGDKDLSIIIRDGGPIEPPELREVTEPCREQAPETGSGSQIKRALLDCLEQHQTRIVEIVAARMAELARERGFRLIWLEVPTLGVNRSRQTTPYAELLTSLGFEHLDVSDAFAGHRRRNLEVAPWDSHPNALAHRLIADRLYDLLLPELSHGAIAGSTPALRSGS